MRQKDPINLLTKSSGYNDGEIEPKTTKTEFSVVPFMLFDLKCATFLMSRLCYVTLMLYNVENATTRKKKKLNKLKKNPYLLRKSETEKIKCQSYKRSLVFKNTKSVVNIS